MKTAKTVLEIHTFDRGGYDHAGVEYGHTNRVHRVWDDELERVFNKNPKTQMTCVHVEVDPDTGDRKVLNCVTLAAVEAKSWFSEGMQLLKDAADPHVRGFEAAIKAKVIEVPVSGGMTKEDFQKLREEMKAELREEMKAEVSDQILADKVNKAKGKS